MSMADAFGIGYAVYSHSWLDAFGWARACEWYVEWFRGRL